MVLRFFVVGVGLIIVLGGLYIFAHGREQGVAATFANNKPQPVPVAVAPATTESLPQALTTIGTVQAVEQVTVTAELGGKVVQILFQPGQQVHAGDPLVQLNDAPDQADLLNYQAQERLAQITLQRSRNLVTQQFASQATVDQNQAQMDQVRASMQKTEAVIGQKRIKAPFDGQLGIRQVNLGDYVSPGVPIVTLTNLDRLFVNFTLPEKERSKLAIGQEVRIVVDAYPNATFQGALTRIEPQIDPDTRVVKLQATFANPDHRLQSGMFASVSAMLPPEPNVVMVPQTAIENTLYGDSVFVVADGRDDKGNPILTVKRVVVKIGAQIGDRVAVLDGLQPGDRVVAAGQVRLNDGAVVTISTSNVLQTPATLPNT